MQHSPMLTLAKPLDVSHTIRPSPRQPYPSRSSHGVEATSMAEFVRRYRAVVQVNPAADAWVYQAREQYGAGFRNLGLPMTDDHLRDHLTGAGWIASRAAVDADGEPLADRVAFDLDLERGASDAGESGLADLHARYSRIRNLMGMSRTPLVHGSPGGGLRVAYAIPPRPLRDLIEGPSRGLVADALAAAGLVIGSGRLETFPQRRQADRLPLGRGMPILDAETLTPVIGSTMRQGGDGAWRRVERWAALEALEHWRAHPHDDLVEHLRTLSAGGAAAAGNAAGLAVGARDVRRGAREVGAREQIHVVQDGDECEAPAVPIIPGPALDAYVRRGVPASGQRYATEFRVAMAFVASPERYAEFGLSATSRNDDEIATALTEWLACHHNGNSAEWNDAAAGGNVDRARAVFLGRYRARDAAQRTIVDRAREALLWERAADRPTIYPGQEAFLTLLEVAVRRFPTTARRWSFVTWTLALQRVSRLQALRGRGLGAAVHDGAVVWQIYSIWAKQWPGGSGTCTTASTGTAQTAYAAYLQVLEAEGLIELVAPHVTPWDATRALRPGIDYRPRRSDSSDHDRIRGECATYRVRLLGPVVHEGTLPFRPEVLELATRNAPPRHRKPVSIDEMLHAAWAGAVRERMKRHYGARQWEHVAVLQEVLMDADRRLGGHPESVSRGERAA